MISSDWVRKLKVGDRVPLRWGLGDKYKILTVKKLTKTQVVFANNLRIRLRDGEIVGSTAYDRSRVCEPTPKMLKIAMRSSLNSKIAHLMTTLNVVDLTDEQATKLNIMLVELS